MGEVIRWRKAVIISLLMHVFFLTVIGLLVAKAMTREEVPEQYIELELISEGARDGAVAGNSATDAAASNKISSMPAAASQSDNSVTTKEQTTSVVTPAHSLSILATEPNAQSIGVSAAFASQGGGAGNGIGLGNGTGSGSGSEIGTGTGTGPGTGSGKSGNGGGGIIPPGISSQAEPVYPSQAKQAGQEGTVVLKIQILENGSAGNVSVYQSSGWNLLDDAAVDAAEQWRFIPAKERESGQTIVCYITLPVVFRLKT